MAGEPVQDQSSLMEFLWLDPAPQLNSGNGPINYTRTASYLQGCRHGHTASDGRTTAFSSDGKEGRGEADRGEMEPGRKHDRLHKNSKKQNTSTQCSTSPFRCHLSSCSYFNGTLTENSSSVFIFPLVFCPTYFLCVCCLQLLKTNESTIRSVCALSGASAL